MYAVSVPFGMLQRRNPKSLITMRRSLDVAVAVEVHRHSKSLKKAHGNDGASDALEFHPHFQLYEGRVAAGVHEHVYQYILLCHDVD